MTAAFRVLVAFCVLASTGAFAACVGDDDQDADPKAERAERQRTEAPDERSEEENWPTAARCARLWNETASDYHLSLFSVYSASAARLRAQGVPGYPPQGVFVNTWNFAPIPALAINPHGKVTIERGACVVVSGRVVANAPSSILVEVDGEWRDVTATAEMGAGPTGQPSSELLTIVEVATRTPNGIMRPDGRISFPGLGEPPPAAEGERSLEPDSSTADSEAPRSSAADGDDVGPVWPSGTSGWTVILASKTSRAEAEAFAADAADHGSTGVLHSDEYSSLRPGYWVAFAGRFDDSEEAKAAASLWRDRGFGDAYPRFVAP